MVYRIPNLQKLIELHNSARKKGTWFFSDISPLTYNIALSNYAQKWAEYMADEDRIIHSSMSSIMSIGFSRAGENIAYGQKDEHQVMKSWLRSYGHKRNIMNKSFSLIGCGFAYSKGGIPYWCVCFASK